MKNDELATVLQELAQVGIRSPTIVKGRRHWQVRWSTPNGVERMYTLACTGSDWRGAHNARSGVRRMLRADGLLPERPEPRPQASATQPRDWRTEIDRLRERVARLEEKLRDGRALP
jgi:hypothetical protein